jgi:DNA-binding transcriptional MocR family regulator
VVSSLPPFPTQCYNENNNAVKGVIVLPINSFDDYPMAWKPRKEDLYAPIYICLADMMEQDILSGALAPNTKMPPLRELADFLDLNLSTVRKAYKLCEMRGLLRAEIGRGTFVVPSANVATSIVEKDSHPDIEMGTILPFDEENQLIRNLTLMLLQKPGADRLFSYDYPLGTKEQIRSGSLWLQKCGIETADTDTTFITNGVQNALAILLSSFFEGGNRIAVDPYTYSNFISVASLLHLQLVAVENDAEGMRSDLLERFCATQNIKGIYLMPTGSNPTNQAISKERREELAHVIKKYGLILLEDDNYSALLTKKLPPLCLEVPEQSLYISGLSKPICPGLRIAYVHAPSKWSPILERGAFSFNLKLSSLTSEIASQVIKTGLADQILLDKRKLSISRNKIYHTIFPKAPYHPISYCQWLTLPRGCTGQDCEKKLMQQGVGVFGAERFAVGNNVSINAIRIATCSPGSEAKLEQGLQLVKKYIEEHS